jgi:DNA-binding Lrp family transcriptional regulator
VNVQVRISRTLGGKKRRVAPKIEAPGVQLGKSYGMPAVEKDHGKIGVCFIETMCLLVVVEIIDPAFSG